MASFVATSATVLYGSSWTGTAPGPANPTVSGTIASSTDFSDHVKSVTFNGTAAQVDFTNFGSGGFVENKPGLINVDCSIDFFNDFAASSIDASFGAAFLAKTLLYLDIKPTNSARGATNPSWVGAFYVASYPIAASVGEADMITVQFMSAGKFARLTS